MIVTPRRLSGDVLRSGFSHTHYAKCDLYHNLSATACRHVSVHHFLTIMLQCHVVCSHCFDIRSTHHWELWCEPQWANMPKASRIDHQLVGISLFTKFQANYRPNALSSGVSHCLPAKKSTGLHPHSICFDRVYLRRTRWLRRRYKCPGFFDVFAVLTLAHFWHFGFRFPFAFALRLRLFVPRISSFVSVLSTLSTFTFEVREFLRILLAVAFARVVFSAFVATFLTLAELPFSFPFPGEDIDFHRIIVVSVHTCCRLEDASAPQVTLCCHKQSVKVSQLTHGFSVFEMMHAFFTWWGTRSVPFALSYRRTSSRISFRRSSSSSILVPNLQIIICTSNPVLPS